jgi:hypothetical protein
MTKRHVSVSYNIKKRITKMHKGYKEVLSQHPFGLCGSNGALLFGGFKMKKSYLDILQITV